VTKEDHSKLSNTELSDEDTEYTGVPPQILGFERKLEERFREAEEDGYRPESDVEGYYRCNRCETKIYYSRRKPQSLVQHVTDGCEVREP